MHPRTFNILMLPVVILIRMPVMVPLLLIVKFGEKVEAFANAIGPYLPGFRYNPESRSRF